MRTVEGTWRRVVMAVWGLTGIGKSTHGLLRVDGGELEEVRGGVRRQPLDYVRDQVVKNDDMIAVFEDTVIGSGAGCWTRTEGLTPDQVAMRRAATSPNALHENTEFDGSGNPSFRGSSTLTSAPPNKNSRSGS